MIIPTISVFTLYLIILTVICLWLLALYLFVRLLLIPIRWLIDSIS